MQLFGNDGTTEIGAIRKKYRGFLAEAMTSADTFSIRSKIENILFLNNYICIYQYRQIWM